MKSFLADFLTAIWMLIKLPFIILSVLKHQLGRVGLRRLVMLFLASVFLILFTSISFLKLTSKPGFCKSCHLMRPYITAWENSSHKDVDCMKCHAHEGLTGYFETKFTAISMLANYFTGLYRRSKPWAEIEDKNCLECHSTRLLDGRIEYVKGVVFDHTPHLTEQRRGRRLRCTSCHSQIVQGEHISVTTSTCFLCHFKNVFKVGREEMSECRSCHTQPTAASDGELAAYDHTDVLEQRLSCQSCHPMMWQGSGSVSREKCGNCHSSADHLDKFDDLEFIHEWHIEKRKVECQRCHDAIEHRRPMLDKEIRGNCSGCHQEMHTPMTQVYQGIGSRLINNPMPYSMTNSGVVCTSCHKDSPTGHGGGSAVSISCEPCHDESYRRLARDWHLGFNKRIKKLEVKMRSAGVHPKIEDARHDLALIKQGGAWHNPHFADTLLSHVSSILSQAGVYTEVTAKIPAGSKQCLSCHATISELVVTKKASVFNHRSHLSDRGITCTECHVGSAPENSTHGHRKEASASCARCHHNAENIDQDNCEPCHIPSRNLYFGNIPEVQPNPSPMAEAEMTCTDCHQGPNFHPPGSAFCLDCHDEDVVSHFEFTRSELIGALPDTGRKISESLLMIFLDKGRAVHHPDLAKKVLDNQ